MDVDVPLELVGEVAGARAVAEAGHVEGSAASARHGGGAVFSRMRGQKGALDEAGGAIEREGRGGGDGMGLGWLGDQRTVVSARRKP